MAESRFVYVTYIRTTPEKLWRALIEPEFTRQYWAETWQDCDWKTGASWKLMIPDGRVGDSGEVLEIDPPRRLVLSWQNEFQPELRAEGYSRATLRARAGGRHGEAHRLHEIDKPGLEAHRGGVERLAADPREPQEPARDRRRRSKRRASGRRGCDEWRFTTTSTLRIHVCTYCDRETITT